VLEIGLSLKKLCSPRFVVTILREKLPLSVVEKSGDRSHSCYRNFQPSRHRPCVCSRLFSRNILGSAPCLNLLKCTDNPRFRVSALAHLPSPFLRPNRIPKWTNSRVGSTKGTLQLLTGRGHFYFWYNKGSLFFCRQTDSKLCYAHTETQRCFILAAAKRVLMHGKFPLSDRQSSVNLVGTV
jgi:hypothetical protein